MVWDEVPGQCHPCLCPNGCLKIRKEPRERNCVQSGNFGPRCLNRERCKNLQIVRGKKWSDKYLLNAQKSEMHQVYAPRFSKAFTNMILMSCLPSRSPTYDLNKIPVPTPPQPATRNPHRCLQAKGSMGLVYLPIHWSHKNQPFMDR